MPFAGYTNRDGESSRVYTVGHADDATGALRYIMDAEYGEPLFVIRGRDVLAVPVLKHYLRLCHAHELQGQHDRVEQHAIRFIDWQCANAKLTHMPDPLPDPPAG